MASEGAVSITRNPDAFGDKVQSMNTLVSSAGGSGERAELNPKLSSSAFVCVALCLRCCACSRRLWQPGPEVQKYNISDVVACDAQVAAAMATELEKEIQELGVGVCHGLNVTADSFYSSQGRKDPNFEDGADGLMVCIAARPARSVWHGIVWCGRTDPGSRS